jgi:hypothetical protein
MSDAIGVLIRDSTRPEFGQRIHSLADSPFVRLRDSRAIALRRKPVEIRIACSGRVADGFDAEHRLPPRQCC